MNMPTQSQTTQPEALDPHKIITSFKIEGPTHEAVIALIRLGSGDIEVRMTLYGGTSENWEEGWSERTFHKTYDIAITKAADHARRLISNRRIG